MSEKRKRPQWPLLQIPFGLANILRDLTIAKASSKWHRSVIGIVVCCALGYTTETRGDTSSVWFSCSMQNDTLIVGVKSQIVVWLDSDTDTISNAQCAFLWRFSGPNVVGPLYDTGHVPNVAISPDAHTGFDYYSWGIFLGLRASSPDSTYYNFADVLSGNGYWIGSGELFRFTVIPADTSTIQVLPAFGPQDNEITITSDNHGQTLPLHFSTPVLHIVECASANLIAGDVDFDRLVSSGDIIYLVNYVFKSGSAAVVEIQSDLDCDGSASARDIIWIVNYVFKGLGELCDPCSVLAYDGSIAPIAHNRH